MNRRLVWGSAVVAAIAGTEHTRAQELPSRNQPPPCLQGQPHGAIPGAPRRARNDLECIVGGPPADIAQGVLVTSFEHSEFNGRTNADINVFAHNPLELQDGFSATIATNLRWSGDNAWNIGIEPDGASMTGALSKTITPEITGTITTSLRWDRYRTFVPSLLGHFDPQRTPVFKLIEGTSEAVSTSVEAGLNANFNIGEQAFFAMVSAGAEQRWSDSDILDARTSATIGTTLISTSQLSLTASADLFADRAFETNSAPTNALFGQLGLSAFVSLSEQLSLNANISHQRSELFGEFPASYSGWTYGADISYSMTDQPLTFSLSQTWIESDGLNHFDQSETSFSGFITRLSATYNF